MAKLGASAGKGTASSPLLTAPPVRRAPLPTPIHDFHALPLQAKLEVTPSGDRFEAEADRVADHVMHRDAAQRPPPLISALTGGSIAASLQHGSTQQEPAQRASGKAAAAFGKSAGKTAAHERSEPKLDEEQRGKAGAPKKAAAAQRDATTSDRGFAVPRGTEGAIQSMRAGGGAPMSSDVRRFMEDRIGHDLSKVRVHDSPAAHRAAEGLDARAFTVGRDVFFGSGQYTPSTPSGQRLLAHELTHTVQQSGGSNTVHAKRLQRNGGSETTTPGSSGGAPGSGAISSETTETDPQAATADPRVFTDATAGTIDVNRKTLILPVLELPEVNGNVKGVDISATTTAKAVNADDITGAGQQNWTMRSPTERAGKTQRQMWFEEAEASFKEELKEKFPERLSQPTGERTPVRPDAGGGASSEVFYIRRKARRAASADQMFIGTAEELAVHPEILLPSWNTKGTARSGSNGYQVDHIHELQLGGAHEWDNLWLLQAGANQTSGSKIKAAVERPITQLRECAERSEFWVPERGGVDPGTNVLKKQWRLTYQAIEMVDLGVSAANSEFYRKEDIRDGAHLAGLYLMSDSELAQTGFRVDPGVQPSEISIFPYQNAGTRFRVRREGAPEKWGLQNRTAANFLGGFTKFEITYAYENDVPDGAPLGCIKGTPKPSRVGTQYPVAELPLLKDSRLGYNVYIDPDRLRSFPRSSQFIGLSPLSFSEFGINSAGLLQGQGTIAATHGLFPGLDVPVEVIGERSFIDYPLSADNLALGPVTVDQAALQLGFDDRGLLLLGTADVSVDGLGSGHLEATASARGPRIEGDFNFDTDFLDPATARFVYDMPTDELSLTLNAGVQEGRVPGIERGEVTATIDKEGVDVAGTLYPSGLLAGAEIGVAYTRESGITIELNEYRPPVSDIPAIRDAVVSLGVNKPPDAGQWRFYGSGAASFALPYVTGGLVIAVDNGVITIIGTGRVERPPASGTLNVTVTNQAIDEEGNPVEGAVLDDFRVFGRGSASLTFGIITATAGLELTEEGDIIVDGELALPPTYEVFPERRYDRELLHVEPPEFPIWGVSVAGFGFGIFAFFDAYLNFDAFVGPGTLNDVALNATYTFGRPEDTVIDGSANFNIPAGAGFTVDIGGGVRARVATAQVSGRIGLAARLGLEANAGADVDVHWTPAEGLSLSAEAYANVSPKFRVSANARITASVDLLLAEPSHTWGPWEQVLGEFGPDMAVEARFPVEWSERDGLDLDMDDITVKKPEVNYADLMKDAFLELV